MSGLKWEKFTWADTDNMFFKDYGVTLGVPIPEHFGPYPAANHIRALLDLLEWGNFAVAQGMNDDYICNAKYDMEVFQKVWMIRNLPNWKQIDEFMGKEYWMKWIQFKRQTERIKL